MGCGGSTQENGTKTENRRGSLFFKANKVEIAIGEAVQLNGSPQVIFVFGGPGSRKGRLIDDVTKVYHLKQLNLENILMDALFKKVDEPDLQRKTYQIQELAKAQPEILRFDWMLRQVSLKLDELPKSNCYVIDFMPNLKFLMSPLNGVNDCDNEFKVFESKYPVSFAIDFTVSSEKKRIAPQCAVPKKVVGEGGKQSDEADTGKLERRAALYNNCANIFINYFKKSKRLVTLDVTAHAHDDVWERVCEFFADLEFLHVKNVDTVLFFVFGDDDAQKYKVNMFDAEMVNIKDMAVDISSIPEKVVPALCQFVDDCYPTKKKFIVNLDKSAITKDCMKKWTLLKKTYKTLLDPKKVVQFQDIENCALEDYIRLCSSKIKVPHVKALCSSENEVCLFPNDTPHGLCKYVAGLFRAYQEFNLRRGSKNVLQ